MQRRISFQDKNLVQRGFTLVELLVVIVILGILAAVVVFAVGGITNKGKSSACQIEVRSVNTAIQAYYAQNTAFPATVSALVPAYLSAAPTANTPVYSSTTGVFSETCPATGT